MIDSAYIRDNPDLVTNNLASRGYTFDINTFLELDEAKRGLQKSLEELISKPTKQISCSTLPIDKFPIEI